MMTLSYALKDLLSHHIMNACLTYTLLNDCFLNYSF